MPRRVHADRAEAAAILRGIAELVPKPSSIQGFLVGYAAGLEATKPSRRPSSSRPPMSTSSANSVGDRRRPHSGSDASSFAAEARRGGPG